MADKDDKKKQPVRKDDDENTGVDWPGDKPLITPENPPPDTFVPLVR